MLTQEQLQILKADILADSAFDSVPNTFDGAYTIASAYNLTASPNFTVWRTSVTIAEVGRAFLNSEVAGLTTANTTRLQVFGQYSGGVFNPSDIDVRSGFDEVFSGAGGVNTRAALLALYKRLARRIEKLYAVGAGTDASPATLVFEGAVDYQQVYTARNLP